MQSTGNSTLHDMQWYLDRIAYLSDFMLPEREHTLRKVLAARTRYISICMENTFHPQNASALVRHCDAFGIQDIYTIETTCKFRPNTDIVRGTDQWVDFHRSLSSSDAVNALKAEGYRIVATTPHRGDTTPETFDVTKGRFVLVFGTEHEGVSPCIVDAADEFIRIPMCGFVESLNVSASAAILLYMLSQKVRKEVPEWRLTEEQQAETLFRWMVRTVRDAEKILSRFNPDDTILL